MNKTNIEWTTFSANPLKYRRKSDGKVVWGCVKTSPGCARCYSEAIAMRFERGKVFNATNMEELEPFLDEQELHRMQTAKVIGGVKVDGSRCFVGDMTDIFGEWVPDELLDRLFATFALRPSVTWQVLTKRAARLRRYATDEDRPDRIARQMSKRSNGFVSKYPGDNVHLGVSVEDQARADERIPLLLQCPAAVRFLSCEPLLDAVNLHAIWHDGATFDCLTRTCCPFAQPREGGCEGPGCMGVKADWVIVGGESGPGARPCNVGWIRSIVDQCRAVSVPCFVKQLGSVSFDGAKQSCEASACCVHDFAKLKLSDKKGGDPSEWPEELRVRQFPATSRATAR
jgi:protein gp37